MVSVDFGPFGALSMEVPVSSSACPSRSNVGFEVQAYLNQLVTAGEAGKSINRRFLSASC